MSRQNHLPILHLSDRLNDLRIIEVAGLASEGPPALLGCI